MRFQVRVLQSDHAVAAFELEAADRVEATELATAKGLTVLSIESRQHGLPALWKRPARFNLILFSQELLALLEAGIHVVEALETLAEKEQRPESQHVLAQVVAHLHDGQSLSSALLQLPSVFPPLFVATARASERTGDLAEGLARYVAYANQLDLVKKKLVSASIYPLLLIGAGGLVLMFLMGFIVPKFARIYEDLGSDRLPWLSQWLLRWGGLVQDHGLVLVLLAAASAGLLLYGGSRPELRQALRNRLWAMPAMGSRLRIYQLARFYRTLGMLLRGGTPIATALEMVGGLLQPAFRLQLTAAVGAIREGKAISAAFHEHDLATPVALRMLRVGEHSGRMGEMMERIAAFYDDEIARWIEWFTRLGDINGSRISEMSFSLGQKIPSKLEGIVRSCLKNAAEGRLLRCAVLEILMYYMYIPVSARRAPCIQPSSRFF